MIRSWALIRLILEPKTYIWMDIAIVRETPKAILIIFDDRKAWIPKAWIMRIKRSRNSAIKIKIADYYWAKKFA